MGSILTHQIGVWGYISLLSGCYSSPFGLHPYSPLHLQLKLISAIALCQGSVPEHKALLGMQTGEGSGQLISQASHPCLDGMEGVKGEEQSRAKFCLPHPVSAQEHTAGSTNCLQIHADDFEFPVLASKKSLWWTLLCPDPVLPLFWNLCWQFYPVTHLAEISKQPMSVLKGK